MIETKPRDSRSLKKEIMFDLFKKKSKKEQLQKKYEKLQKESFELSRVDRKLGDEKAAEAEKVMQEILSLPE